MFWSFDVLMLSVFIKFPIEYLSNGILLFEKQTLNVYLFSILFYSKSKYWDVSNITTDYRGIIPFQQIVYVCVCLRFRLHCDIWLLKTIFTQIFFSIFGVAVVDNICFFFLVWNVLFSKSLWLVTWGVLRGLIWVTASKRCSI